MQVILHLGQHKTGSKALQVALHANRELLATRGCAYPVAPSSGRPLRAYELNHHDLFAVLRRAVDQGDGAALGAWLDQRLAAVAPSAKRLILSAEDLLDMHTAHEIDFVAARVGAAARLLARELDRRSCTVKWVCCLRRQDHLLAAHYAQFIKGGGNHDLSFRAFARAFAPRLDADALLSPWEDAFGPSTAIIIPYEPATQAAGIVAVFFRQALGLEPPPVEPAGSDLEAANITPSRDYIEYMRLLNRRAALGHAVLSRALVLQAAFIDQTTPRLGAAAWLSPRERAVLLAEHQAGNRRIAARHGLGDRLFREPPPNPADDRPPPPGPDLSRLVEIDQRTREVRLPDGKRLRFPLLARMAIWLNTPDTTAAERATMLAGFAAIAGHPRIRSRVVARLTLAVILRYGWRRAFVAPPAPGVAATQ